MRVGVYSIVSGLGLVGLAIAAGTRFPGFSVAVTQPVQQTNQQIEKASTPPEVLQANSKVADDCVESSLVALTKELELQKCRLSTNDWFNGRLTLKQGDKERWRFAYPQSTMASDFQAFLADLDGNGAQELIIAKHDGSSNGIAIRYWTVYIFPEPLSHSLQKPLEFAVEEYGRQGTFVQNGNQFEIWTTEWRGSIIGQQWRYGKGQLLPTEHPILERWYSFNFERERGKTYRDPRIPYLWLSSPKVQAHSEHPLLKSTDILNSEDGVIQNIVNRCSSKDHPCITTVTFKPNQGKPRSYSYSRSGHLYTPGEEAQSFAYFGDWSSRRTYPRRYLLADSSKWLHGRTGKLITYKNRVDNQTQFKILWLM